MRTSAVLLWLALGRGALSFVRPALSFVDPKHYQQLQARQQSHRFDTSLEMEASGDAGREFSSKSDHYDFLEAQGRLPIGFSVGTTGFRFAPVELENTKATMNVTVIALDAPTDNWAAVFTRNRFPGSPVILGRRLVEEGGPLQAIVVNNKVANVCPGGGEEAGVGDSIAICQRVAEVWGFPGGGSSVLPGSTGVIGWRLPTQDIMSSLPEVKRSMQSDNMAPAARSIMTTDRFPKLRGRDIGSSGARLVGIAKGAGMIEPNMATMLSYLVTDLSVPRDELRRMLKEAVDSSFNSISVDTDTSTSDTVVLACSDRIQPAEGDLQAFEEALHGVCRDLAEDVVRNGEGTSHVIQAHVKGAPSARAAKIMGKAIVNSPLFKCAVAGNDPNVGRLLAIVGRVSDDLDLDASRARLSLGGQVVFENGKFCISPDTEREIFRQFDRAGMLVNGGHAPYPPHFRNVEIEVDLGAGPESATVYGSDLTLEYVRINADYRS